MTGDASLELYRVSDDFASMLRLRDIMLSEGEDVAPLEKEIALYFSQEVTQEKIDTVIGALRHAETMEEAAIKEAERTAKLADSWATQRKWLKDTVKGVLETAGKKRLDGKTAGYLLLKGNGGKQEVVITQESLIPEELVQYEGRISGKAWKALVEFKDRDWAGFPQGAIDGGAFLHHWLGRQDVQMERVPHKGRIANILSSKCTQCGGSGEDLPAGPSDAPVERCPACDGDGKARVPGAHFAPRGSSVIVR